MKIAVLGVTGILGRAVCSQLTLSGHTVYGYARTPREVPRLAWFHERDLAQRSVIGELSSSRYDWIINCAGVVKSIADTSPVGDVIRVNSAMPHWLERGCQNTRTRIIHISTDCVFDGQRGKYVEEDQPNATDLYGAAKLAGELGGPRSLTLRTSFIGWEYGTSRGLLSWLIGRRGKPVDGYLNALWTGLNSAEVARVIDTIIRDHPTLSGLYHLAGEEISKHNLIVLLNRTLALNLDIAPREDPHVDRRLVGSRLKATIGYRAPSWDEMAAQLSVEAHQR